MRKSTTDQIISKIKYPKISCPYCHKKNTFNVRREQKPIKYCCPECKNEFFIKSKLQRVIETRKRKEV